MRKIPIKWLATGVVVCVLAALVGGLAWYKRRADEAQVVQVYQLLNRHRVEALSQIKYYAFKSPLSSILRHNTSDEAVSELNRLANDMLDRYEHGGDFSKSVGESSADTALCRVLVSQENHGRLKNFLTWTHADSRTAVLFELERLMIKVNSASVIGTIDSSGTLVDERRNSELQELVKKYLRFRDHFYTDDGDRFRRLGIDPQLNPDNDLPVEFVRADNGFVYFNVVHPRCDVDREFGDVIRCALAHTYEEGIGCDRNIDSAKYWYNVSADMGSRSAKDALFRLKDTLRL